MGSGPGRASELNKIRLRLLASSLTELPAEPKFTSALGMVAMGTHSSGYVLIAESGTRSFGAFMIWAARNRLVTSAIFADPDAEPSVHARRCMGMGIRPDVYRIDGTDLVPVTPAPHEPPSGVPAGVHMGQELFKEAGLDVVVVDGVMRGQYLGLEVARVSPDDLGGTVDVGIGSVDREANRVLHGGLDRATLLSRVVAEVASYRKPGSSRHPISTMARERWLLRALVACPQELDLDDLSPIRGAGVRRGPKEIAPAAAIGRYGDRSVLVIACSSTDVGMLGEAADLVSRENPDEVMVVSWSPFPEVFMDALRGLSKPLASRLVPAPWV